MESQCRSENVGDKNFICRQRPKQGNHLTTEKTARTWRLNQLFGKLLASIPLNHVTYLADPGATIYRKRRRWYAGMLIWGATTFLRPNFYVLPQRDWLNWEAGLYHQFYGWEVQVEGSELLMPAIPGTRLIDFLQSPHEIKLCARPSTGSGRTDKIPFALSLSKGEPEPVEGPKGNSYLISLQLAAIAAAIRALRQLHETRVCFPGGGEDFFSHGDASARNVIYEPESGLARWFDFETVHARCCPREWRWADDLRALTYSVAAFLPPSQFAALAQSLCVNYPDRATLSALASLAGQLRHQPDPFHFGQTRIDDRRNELWTTILQVSTG